MNFEICIDSLDGAIAADKYGAKRVELCSALAVGGLTPSYGLIQACRTNTSIEIHAMIRHKEGGFQYSSADIEIMKADINMAKEAGAHGVVFGILTEENEISASNMELLELAKSLNLEVTYHRAFDFVKDPFKGLETIISMGFDRLLTSGQRPTAIEGLSLINKLQANYGEQIQIMAGSGVNPSNAIEIAASGINNLHFTARKQLAGAEALEMGEVMVVDEEKLKGIIRQF